MTICTERELLKKALEYLPSDASVFHRIRAFLADTPACDAEKAVLVAALDMAIDTLALDEELPRPAGKLEAWVAKYGDVTDYGILVRLRKIRADIPPAAAALLAQGEKAGWLEKRLRRRSQDWHDEMKHSGVWSTCDLLSCSVDKEALAGARAALAPGEETG